MKIGRCAEQTLDEKSTEFAGFEGAQLPAFTVALLWLLHRHRWHQLVSLGQSEHPWPGTAAPQLCSLCEHAVLANLI